VLFLIDLLVKALAIYFHFGHVIYFYQLWNNVDHPASCGQWKSYSMLFEKNENSSLGLVEKSDVG
jgi:hypothetical protein